MSDILDVLPTDCWFRRLHPKTDDAAAWNIYTTILNTDWCSISGYGPLESWPVSLRTLTAVLLQNTFPCALYWGEDLHILYNAGYARDIACQKHPWLMGKAYEVGWKEVWESSAEFRAEISTAKDSGITTHADNVALFVNRGDFGIEEAYFSYSHAPIYADSGKFGGLFATAMDCTRQVIGARRNELLREIGTCTTKVKSRKEYFETLSVAFNASVLETPLITIYVSEDWTFDSSVDDTRKPIKYRAELTVGAREHISVTPISFADQGVSSGSEWEGLLKEAVNKRHTIVAPQSLRSKICTGRAHNEVCGQIRILPFFTGTDTTLPLTIIACGSNPRRPVDQESITFIESLCNLIVLGLAELKRTEQAEAVASEQRRLLEAELALRTAEVLRSEQKFARMATVSPSGIFQLDRISQKITYANDTWFSITGVPIGSDPNVWPDHLHPDDLSLSRSSLEKFVKGETFLTVTYRWIKEGQIVYSQVSTVTDEGIVFGVLTDITPEIKARDVQRLRAEEAEEHKRAQETFLDFTSHELRNPLSAIVGSCDYLMDQTQRHCEDLQALALRLTVEDRTEINRITSTLRTSEDLQTIISCTTHMSNIIGDVLVVSKLDGNHMQLSETICKPLEEIEGVMRMFQRDMEAKKISHALSIDESWANAHHAWAMIDCARFKQILINLINNAIKFSRDSPRKEIQTTVSVSGTKNSQKLVVSVQDYGCGISEAGQSKLFAKFSQGSPRTAVHYGGSGLGLHICRRLAILMGGEITCQSDEGQGSTFRFEVAYRPEAPPVATSSDSEGSNEEIMTDEKSPLTTLIENSPITFDQATEKTHDIYLENLPMEKEEKAEKEEKEEKESRETRESKQSKESTRPIVVLLTEDNIINQKILAKQLRSTGKYTVLIANHGLEAIEILQKAQVDGLKIDICLCDIEMPICDGLECVRRVRLMELEKKLHHRLPFVACSANARPDQVASMLGAGMDTTLSKPFRLSQVEEKIKEQLARGST